MPGAGPIAKTLNLCLPGLRFLYLAGDSHRLVFLSSVHMNVEFSSVEANRNFALVLVVSGFGVLLSVVFGIRSSPPPPVHGFSVGVTELFRGDGGPSAKSVELVLVS